MLFRSNYRNKGQSNLDIANSVASSDPEFGSRVDRLNKMNISPWQKEVLAREGLDKWFGSSSNKNSKESDYTGSVTGNATQKFSNPTWISNILHGLNDVATAPGETMFGAADYVGNAIGEGIRPLLGKKGPSQGLLFNPQTEQLTNLRENATKTLDNAPIYSGIVGAAFGMPGVGSAVGEGIKQAGHDIIGDNPNTALQQASDVALSGAFGKIVGGGGATQTI